MARSERRRRIKLHNVDKNVGCIDLVPGRVGYPQGTYLWIGGENGCFGYTKCNMKKLSIFAHAILRSIGEEA